MTDSRPKKRRFGRFVTSASIVAVVIMVGIAAAFPPVWRLTKGPIEVVQWRRVQGEVNRVVGPTEAGWIRAKDISKHVFHAIVVAEDASFYQHYGLDLTEIARSVRANIDAGAYVRGGSTITQQLVKMSFLSREKSLIRKVREAAGTLVVERLLSKDEILEWYINLAEFGDGVYGLREAADHYFAIKPELLTIAQSIHLALVLPSPNSWSLGLRRKQLTDFGHSRFSELALRLKQRGFITTSQWQTTMSTGNFGSPIDGYPAVETVP